MSCRFVATYMSPRSSAHSEIVTLHHICPTRWLTSPPAAALATVSQMVSSTGTQVASGKGCTGTKVAFLGREKLQGKESRGGRQWISSQHLQSDCMEQGYLPERYLCRSVTCACQRDSRLLAYWTIGSGSGLLACKVQAPRIKSGSVPVGGAPPGRARGAPGATILEPATGCHGWSQAASVLVTELASSQLPPSVKPDARRPRAHPLAQAALLVSVTAAASTAAQM